MTKIKVCVVAADLAISYCLFSPLKIPKLKSTRAFCFLVFFALFINALYCTSQQEYASDFCFLLSWRFSLMYGETHKMSRWTEIFQSDLLEGSRWVRNEMSLFVSSRFVIFFEVAATVKYMKTCVTCLCYFLASKDAWQSAPLHFRKKKKRKEVL